VVALAGLLALGGSVVFSYFNADRNEMADSKAGFSQAPQQKKSAEEFSTSAIGDNAKKLSAVSQTQIKTAMPFIAPEIIAQWSAAASDDDAGMRAAAIAAFAAAPKVQAVPALQKILNGGAGEDRQLALQSLRILQANQGDADGEIRNILRLTIYDGGDAEVSDNAQTLLDTIEGATDSTDSTLQPRS
jgi:hypothetical protein